MGSESGMTAERREHAALMSALRTAYPQSNFLGSKEAVELWYKMLRDIPLPDLQRAVTSYIMEEHFPPAISDIRQRAFKSQIAQIPDWEQGWEALMRAISRWGYSRESEALTSLPPLAAETTRRIGYKAVCASEAIGVERAAFRDIYTRIAEREQQNLQLPGALKTQYYQRVGLTDRPQIEAAQRQMIGDRNQTRTEGYAAVAVSRIKEKI